MMGYYDVERFRSCSCLLKGYRCSVREASSTEQLTVELAKAMNTSKWMEVLGWVVDGSLMGAVHRDNCLSVFSAGTVSGRSSSSATTTRSVCKSEWYHCHLVIVFTRKCLFTVSNNFVNASQRPCFLDLKFPSHEEAWKAYFFLEKAAEEHPELKFSVSWIRSSWYLKVMSRAREKRRNSNSYLKRVAQAVKSTPQSVDKIERLSKIYNIVDKEGLPIVSKF